jgi:hypothetical protein
MFGPHAPPPPFPLLSILAIFFLRDMSNTEVTFEWVAQRISRLLDESCPESYTLEKASQRDDFARLQLLDHGQRDLIVNLKTFVGRHLDIVFDLWTLAKRHMRDGHYKNAEKTKNLFLLIRLMKTRTFAVHKNTRVTLPSDLEHFRSETVAASWLATVSSILLEESLRANVDEPEPPTFHRPPLLLSKTPSEYGFVRALLAQHQTSLVVTANRVERMSVSEWKLTLDAAWEAVGRFGWTPSAHALLHALFLRYALWLAYDPEDSPLDATDLRRVYDYHPLCHRGERQTVTLEQDDGHESTVSPSVDEASILPDPHLRVAFVFHLEKTLFFVRRHTEAIHAFVSHSQARPLVMPVEWRRNMLQSFRKFAQEVANDDKLSSEVTEIIKTLIMRRQLLPGEADRTLYENGSYLTSEVESEGVLWDSRRDEFMRLQSDVIDLTLMAHVSQWIDLSLKSSADRVFTGNEGEWDAVAAARPRNERTAFLVFEQIIEIRLKKLHVTPTKCSMTHYGYSDDAGLRPPLDAPPVSPDQASSISAACPVWVSMSQTYHVVIPTPTRSVNAIWYTPHLIDALAMWIHVALQRKLMPPSVVTPTILEGLRLLPVLN